MSLLSILIESSKLLLDESLTLSKILSSVIFFSTLLVISPSYSSIALYSKSGISWLGHTLTTSLSTIILGLSLSTTLTILEFLNLIPNNLI